MNETESSRTFDERQRKTKTRTLSCTTSASEDRDWYNNTTYTSHLSENKSRVGVKLRSQSVSAYSNNDYSEPTNEERSVSNMTILESLKQSISEMTSSSRTNTSEQSLESNAIYGRMSHEIGLERGSEDIYTEPNYGNGSLGLLVIGSEVSLVDSAEHKDSLVI